MSFLSRFWPGRKSEARHSTARTSDPYLAEFFGFRGSGVVSADTVLSNSAVAVRCVTLKSELLASVPCFTFRRTAEGGRERERENPLYGVLHDIANPYQSAFELREFLIRCLDLHGNAYARIERNGRGQVIALHPLAPGVVTVERLNSGRLRYKVADHRGGTEILLQEEMLHIRGPSRDGVMGQSPIAIARGALSLAMSQRETAQALMDNGLRPSGTFTFPGQLSPAAREQVREAVRGKVAGASNSGTFLIMDGGAKYERMALSFEDAQFLETMKFSAEEIARIFGVPPTAVGILDKGTYSNVEQEAQSLVQNCLGPLAGRIEAAMTRCLLSDESRKSIYIEHDLSGLLRGDIRSRFESYRMGREIGVYSANDVRRRENEPPVDGGDAYHMPVNWQRLDAPQPPGAA